MVGEGALYEKLATMMTSDHASVVSLNIFVALLCTCIIIGHLLEENRWINESITALLIVSTKYYITVNVLLCYLFLSFRCMKCYWWLVIAGFVHRCVNIVYDRRKKLAYNGFQWRSFLYLPSPTHHFQCRVRLVFYSFYLQLYFFDRLHASYFDFAVIFFICHRFQVKKKQFFRNFMTIMLFGAIGTLISFCIISLGAIHFFQKLNIGSLKIGDYLGIYLYVWLYT